MAHGLDGFFFDFSDLNLIKKEIRENPSHPSNPCAIVCH